METESDHEAGAFERFERSELNKSNNKHKPFTSVSISTQGDDVSLSKQWIKGVMAYTFVS